MDSFDHCEALVRAADKDRYLATLFAPERCRRALFALYAFNVEVARIRELAREPMPGEIRLQWWRDVFSSGGGSDFPDKTYRYDPNTNTWDDSAIADLPAYRSAAASGVYNGRWILAGGDVNFGISSSVMAWDPASNTWSNLPNMVQARDNLGGATVGQSFYAVAGNSGPGPPTNDNQQYTETPCGTPTPTPTSTVTPTATPTPTATARPVPAPRSRPTPAPRP